MHQFFKFSAQIAEVSDTPLRRVIDTLGGWPVTDSAWDPDRAPELEVMLAVIKRNFTLGVLIEEWVGPDDRNSQNHIIQIGIVYLISVSSSYIVNCLDNLIEYIDSKYLKVRF